MAARQGGQRASPERVLLASFLAGLACAAGVTAATIDSPIAEPFFGLEPPATQSANTQEATAQRVAKPPVAPPQRRAGDLAQLAEALGQPPERIALAEPAPQPAPQPAPAPPPPSEPVDGYVTVDAEAEAVAPHPAASLRELFARTQQARLAAVPPASDARPATTPPAAAAPNAPPSAAGPAAAAPLPGPEWTDPDGVNWAESPPRPAGPPESGSRLLGRLSERLGGQSTGLRDADEPRAAGRLLERLRTERRASRIVDEPPAAKPDPRLWPQPAALVAQLERLAGAATNDPAAAAEVEPWCGRVRAELDAVLATAGPHDAAAAEKLLPLGEQVEAGMQLADRLHDAALASEARRAALAVKRRVAVWRAAAAVAGEADAARGDQIQRGTASQDVGRLLAALEEFESTPTSNAAAGATAAIEAIADVRDLAKAVGDHYLAPNVRISLQQPFVSRLLPEATVTTGPLQDFVLGRRVRGRKTVEQSTDVRFVPDAGRLRFELIVNGEVASRTVTESGPVEIHSRGEAQFVVRKPITVSAEGLAFQAAVGTASNHSKLADIQTSFDAVPIMGPLVRNIARSQVDESHGEATREVNDRIITRACSEVDAQAEPRFTEMAERIRRQIWQPLVALGLEPTPVALETTAALATIRLRLAGQGQLAAHTPRPREPADSLLSLQVHESSVNNATERLGLAGRRLALEDLITQVCGRIGIPARIPDDLPEGVSVTFASRDPLRVECRDGLVHVQVALDALESGRRSWYDIVARVSYRPVGSGPQVMLERDGPVQLAGPGQQGRMELGLRTIFGKIFAKERPVSLLPDTLAAHPRLADVQAVQALCADGWFALALAPVTQAAAPPATPRVSEQPRRSPRR